MRCCICLEETAKDTAAGLDSCIHLFCKECILEWSNTCTSCPLCNSKFSEIRCNESGQVIPVFAKVQRVHGDDDVELWGEGSGPGEVVIPAEDEQLSLCEICRGSQDEEILLLCDYCNAGVHLYCLEVPLSEIPQGLWICSDCERVCSSQIGEEESEYEAEMKEIEQDFIGKRTRRKLCIPSSKREVDGLSSMVISKSAKRQLKNWLVFSDTEDEMDEDPEEFKIDESETSQESSQLALESPFYLETNDENESPEQTPMRKRHVPKRRLYSPPSSPSTLQETTSIYFHNQEQTQNQSRSSLFLGRRKRRQPP